MKTGYFSIDALKWLNGIFNKNHDWFDYTELWHKYDDWHSVPAANGGYYSDGSVKNDNSVLGGFGKGLTSIFENLPELMNSLVTYYAHNTLTGAELEQNEWNAAEAQKSRDFTQYMAENKYSMETQSMQNAGINPAMVYGNGNLVPTASNGATGQGSVGAGGDLFAMLSTMMRLPMEIKNMENEIKHRESEIDLNKANEAKTAAEAHKIEQEAEGQEQYNRWFVDTYELRKEGLELANNLTSAQERAVYKQMDVMEENIKKAQSETVRNIAAAMLDNANARKIVEMLPYEKAYTQAKTEEARAAASLAAVNAAYQKRLLNDGYLDALIDKAKAEAHDAQSRAQLDAIKQSIRNGTYGEIEYNGKFFHDAAAWFNNQANDVLGAMVLFMDNLNPLANMFGGQ